MSSPAAHQPADLLAAWWRTYRGRAEDYGLIPAGPARAPGGETWPGLAPAQRSAADPDEHAAAVSFAAVVRSWEDRFGVRVVGVGFATLHLSVAAPPLCLEDARVLAAEHLAFCPDVLGQAPHPHTLAAYAEHLVDAGAWNFWWD
ncbi:hypothetical protein GCM10010245_90970 [Streptomyces spectabilis]|uniref:DUF4253 domain-containing protein n=1 Tax=Streptomyces spectabilis TaxID=68270 RepID=A0A7W8EZ93_STRST|nr:DUF4253 domain-containing protein [Streptomyces spectabilis]MBB5109691.1 hypothetical protein [Streptomyces spectabilis]GGV57859.1 hypothetical protein GCM10010245_90970 [Streptomyces spectabilis]